LDVLGERIAHRYKLICFDEFHVADITDALILHRLLVALHTHEVGFVTTSNFKPDDLYPGGMHRDRVLGAIAFLNQHMQVINVDNGTDYRRLAMGALDLYHVPNGPVADEAMAQAFASVAEAQDGDQHEGGAGQHQRPAALGLDKDCRLVRFHQRNLGSTRLGHDSFPGSVIEASRRLVFGTK
jgi:predicted ATPase